MAKRTTDPTIIGDDKLKTREFRPSSGAGKTVSYFPSDTGTHKQNGFYDLSVYGAKADYPTATRAYQAQQKNSFLSGLDKAAKTNGENNLDLLKYYKADGAKNESALPSWYSPIIDTSGSGTSKNSGGAKTDGENNLDLLKYYTTPETATDTTETTETKAPYADEKAAQEARLMQERERQAQQAYIGYQNLLKYMPQANKANGLSGLGIADSTALQAYANYASQRGQIDQDYQDQMSDLERYYTDKTESYMDKMYAQAKEDMSNRKYATSDELKDYLMKNYGVLDETRMASLQNLAQAQDENLKGSRNDGSFEAIASAYATDIEEYIKAGEYDKATEKLNKAKDFLSDDFFKYYEDYINERKSEQVKEMKGEDGTIMLETNNGAYELGEELSDTDNRLTKNNSFKKQLEDAGYSWMHDEKIPNGTTFKIKSDATGRNDFNFWTDIAAPFVAGSSLYGVIRKAVTGDWSALTALDSVFDWHTEYVTYYNGKWYKSSKK